MLWRILALSEYQYYEFLAVDRPLDASDRHALRALSTRATITATRFVNSYQWGDFKGDPAQLMERWFDLHLYWANWGTRRLMLRLPRRFVNRPELGSFIDEVDGVTIRAVGDHIVVDIAIESDDGEWDDGEEEDDGGWLATLAPLRTEVINGDLRLFYLLWLTALEAGALRDETPEPLPGIGPLTGSLKAFADFIRVDPDLLHAASEGAPTDPAGRPEQSAEAMIATLTQEERTALLVRLFQSDPHAGTELRRLLRQHRHPDAAAFGPQARTVGALRDRAAALRLDRERAQAEAAEEQRRRKAEDAETQRRVRLDALAGKGEAVWREVEGEIDRRNAPGYARAVALLSDLRALAAARGLTADFDKRLAAIRSRHAQKGRFVERLDGENL